MPTRTTLAPEDIGSAITTHSNLVTAIDTALRVAGRAPLDLLARLDDLADQLNASGYRLQDGVWISRP